MIKPPRFMIAMGISLLIPCYALAAAPVVDESENFAILDRNEAADEQPLARENHTQNERRHRAVNDAIDMEYNDEQPIAQDTSAHNKRNQNNASLLNRIQSLEQEVQELRGQLEIQSHELSLLKEQQLTFYKDLDARIRGTAPLPKANAEKNPPIQTAPSIPLNEAQKVVPITNITPTAGNNPAEEQIRYLAAYDLVKSKRYPEAIKAMQSFADQYPKGGYTANAHYWLGELYMTQKNYPQSIQHFDTVLQQFPSSNKSAPSLLKSAYALAASGKKQEAIARLQQVIKNYPDTKTAQLAEQKLKTLGR